MAAPKLVDLLRGMEIFAPLPDAELAKLAKLLKERKYPENHLLFRQGARGDALYIVLSGRVKIFVADQFGREKVLAFNGAGEFFGDMALLTGAPRAASAETAQPTRLLELRKEDFDALLAGNVELMKEMLRVMAERQATVNQRVTQEASAETGGSKGLLTVIFSPRGGSGRSTVAANLGVLLAQTAPDRVAIADLDVLFGHVAVLLNLAPRAAIASATPSAIRHLDRDGLAFYLTTHEESSLRVLAGSTRPEEGELLSGDHVRAALEQLLKHFVHVVVDTGPNFSDATLAAIELADRVLLVCTPELTSARDIRECQRIFFELLGLPREKFVYLLNHTFPYEGVPRAQFEQAIAATFVEEIPFGGEQVAEAALTGEPLAMKWSNNPVSKALANVARTLDRAAKEALALAGR